MKQKVVEKGMFKITAQEDRVYVQYTQSHRDVVDSKVVTSFCIKPDDLKNLAEAVKLIDAI